MPESEAENTVESAYQGGEEPVLPNWTIFVQSVGGDDLHDCHIIEVGPDEYKFTDPDFNSLSDSNIFPPVFREFDYKNLKWTVEVNTGLKNLGEFIIGSWSFHDRLAAAEKDGEWTAQAGGGADQKRAKAASADAS